MGRYKRKKLYNSGNSSSFGVDEEDSASPSFLKSSSTVSESSMNSEGSVSQESKNHFFNRKDKKIVLQYLQDYKRGALQLYHQKDEKDVDEGDRNIGDKVPRTTSVNGRDNKKAEAKHTTRTRPVESNEPISINYGGNTVKFPLLAHNVLSQPYFSLPKGLTSNQRKYIHEICVDLNLFHHSVGGDEGEDRHIVISIYRDGLSHVPELSNNQENHTLIELRQFQPWAVQRIPPTINFHTIFGSNATTESTLLPSNKGVDETKCTTQEPIAATTNRIDITKMAKSAIEALNDQPGQCVRDNIDELDFELLKDMDLSSIPKPGFETDEWLLVDTPSKMKQCIQELEDAKPTEIAFDLEAYNKSRHAQITCLLQITSNHGKEYVIDPLAPGVWDEVNGLAPLFANPNIVKVGHSIGGLDVRCLHRDFGIFVVNAFDTFEAAATLRLSSKGLANVCAHYGMSDFDYYVKLKSQYQNTDWRQRPLTKEMIEYGRYDIHYLLNLRKVMMRDLSNELITPEPAKQAEARQVAASLAAILGKFDDDDEEEFGGFHSFGADDDVDDEIPPQSDDDDDEFQDTFMEEPDPLRSKFGARDLRMDASLMRAISQSQDRCLSLWSGEPESHSKNKQILTLMQKSRNGEIDALTDSQIELYSSLAQWRQYAAGKVGCLPGFICNLDVLALIAYKRPTSEAGLRQVSYSLPESFRALGSSLYLDELLQLVMTSRKADGLDLADDSNLPSYTDFVDRRKKHRLEIASKAIAATAFVAVAAFAAQALSKRRK